MKHIRIPKPKLRRMSDAEFERELIKYEKFRKRMNEYENVLIIEKFSRLE